MGRILWMWLALVPAGQAATLAGAYDALWRDLRLAAERASDADLNARPASHMRTLRELFDAAATAQSALCGTPLAGAADSQKETLQRRLRSAAEACGRAPETVRVDAFGQLSRVYGEVITYLRLRNLPAPGEPAGTPPKFEMSPYFIGILKKGPNWSPQATPAVMEIQKGHIAHLEAMGKAGHLVVAGPLTDGGDLRGILIFRGGEPIERIKALAGQDPAVKAGRLAVDLHPWLVQKGVLP